MEAKKSRVTIKYKDKDITRDMLEYIQSISYEDASSGESDTLSVSIGDRQRKWIGGWMPEKGDKITATIKTYNWEKDGDERKLVCGEFIVDSMNVSGEPLVIDIGAISGPVSKGFRETSRNKTWRKTNIKKIGQTVAKRYGIKLFYDAPTITVKELEQGDTDSAFLNSLCETYNLVMKAYKDKIVIFDRERYKKKAAKLTIDRKSSVIESWTFTDTLTKKYTGGQLTYTNPKTNKDVKKTVGKKTVLLKIEDSADSAADAERKIKAAVNKENHGKTTMSLTLMGDTRLVSGICINMKNFGSKISGKYFIDKASHAIGADGSGYVTSIEISKVVAGL